MKIWLLALLIVLLAACQPQSPSQVTILVDGSSETLTTQSTTVREALQQAKIELGDLDRVSPDLYAEIEPGMEIKVTRIREEIETEEATIPFERETVVNEALAPGETRLAQLGANGQEQITIRVVYEDDQEVSRTEVSRTTLVEPVPEILVVGPQPSTLPTVPIEGTLAYLSNGNAWLMRDINTSRRALTTEGDLDERVFSLSPDGRHLLYTRALTAEIDLPLNELWLASTTIVGEQPITLGIQGVLHAEWSPVLTETLIAYTTAERTAGPPGWQANNDLWLLTLPAEAAEQGLEQPPEPVELLPANSQGLYAWWGLSFSWSPDGTKLAYARADQIGLIDVQAEDVAEPEDRLTPLIDFAPLQTFSDWVWLPGLSWSPDGQFVAAVVHGPPLAAEPPEESQVFDLWLLSTDGRISAKVAEQVGMWANPVWGDAGIAYGQAFEPLQSATSRYKLMLMDRDGSNKRQLFPFQTELGVQLPELVWGPAGETLLFTYNGNLYTVNQGGSLPRQLTANAQVSLPRWAETIKPVASPTLTQSQIITAQATLTVTVTTTASPSATPRPSRTATPSPRATPTSSPAVETASSTPPLTPSRSATPSGSTSRPVGPSATAPPLLTTSPAITP